MFSLTTTIAITISPIFYIQHCLYYFGTNLYLFICVCVCVQQLSVLLSPGRTESQVSQTRGLFHRISWTFWSVCYVCWRRALGTLFSFTVFYVETQKGVKEQWIWGSKWVTSFSHTREAAKERVRLNPTQPRVKQSWSMTLNLTKVTKYHLSTLLIATLLILQLQLNI